MDALLRAWRGEKGAVDGIDRLLEVAGFDQEVECHPGGTEGDHLHIDMRGGHGAVPTRIRVDPGRRNWSWCSDGALGNPQT